MKTASNASTAAVARKVNPWLMEFSMTNSNSSNVSSTLFGSLNPSTKLRIPVDV